MPADEAFHRVSEVFRSNGYKLKVNDTTVRRLVMTRNVGLFENRPRTVEVRVQPHGKIRSDVSVTSAPMLRTAAPTDPIASREVDLAFDLVVDYLL